MSEGNFVTPFAERFGLRVPVVQAPMAGATTPELVAAVSNNGGLGTLALESGGVGADGTMPPYAAAIYRRRAAS